MGQSGKELCTMLWLGRFHWLLRAFLLGLICSHVAAPLGYGQIAGQVAESPTSLLPGGPAVELTVAPSSTTNLLLSVPQGQTVVLSFAEIQQTSVITWTDSLGKVHLPRTNRSGQGARILFTVAENGVEPERFAVTTGSGKRAAHLLVSAGVPRGENESDKAAAMMEESLAEGDLLWSKHDPKTRRKRLPLTIALSPARVS